jgi:hypothetical protein
MNAIRFGTMFQLQLPDNIQADRRQKQHYAEAMAAAFRQNGVESVAYVPQDEYQMTTEAKSPAFVATGAEDVLAVKEFKALFDIRWDFDRKYQVKVFDYPQQLPYYEKIRSAVRIGVNPNR